MLGYATSAVSIITVGWKKNMYKYF